MLAVVPIITSAYLVSKARPKQWGTFYSYLYEWMMKRLRLNTMYM